MLSEPAESVRRRADALAEQIASQGVVGADVVSSQGAVGGGTYPGVTVASFAVALPSTRSADAWSRALRAGDPAVVGRIEDDRFLLDVRTLGSDELPAVASCVAGALAETDG